MSKFTKQKSGYYRTTVQIGFDASGKPIKKYLSALTIKELETKVLETKQSISSGLMVGDNTLFGAYASRWIDIYKSTKGIQTVNMYRNALRKTEPLFGTAVNKITRSMIQDLINSQSNHPRTCEVLLLTLKQIFKSAAADGLIVRDPCISIALPRHIKKEKRALTDEERLKLRSAVLLPQERLLLLILYGTGCRPGEAYALTKADIDIRQGCIHINKSAIFDGNRFAEVAAPKTNTSIRDVIISESIMRSVKHLADRMPNDYILSDEHGQIMNKCQYENMFKRILKKARLSDSGITMYTLRHNFCTECNYAGLSLKECQLQMGHKDYKMVLQVYSHLDQKKENTAAKMSAMVM